MTLTRKQGELLKEIKRFIQEREYSPSIPELARLLGCAVGTIHYHLVSLEGKGFIKRTPGHHGIEVL